MKFRTYAQLNAIMTFALLLSACGGGSTPAATKPDASSTAKASVEETAPALEASQITLGTARDPQLASEMIVALEQGFFEEEGLIVDLQLFQAGSDLTAAIAGNSIPIGSAGDSPSTILKASGTAVQLIAQQSDISGAQSMVVHPDIIAKPSDLNGKKVAYSAGNTSEALFLRIVEHYGLDAGSMDIYKMGPTEMVAAFQKEDIDAFVVWEPTVLTGVKAGGFRLLSASHSYIAGEEGPQKLLGAHSLLIANTEYAKNHPETVKAVLRSLNKAVAFIETNPEEAANHVAGKLQTDAADIRTMMDLNQYSLAITPELIDDIRGTAEFLKVNEKIKDIPDYAEFVNASYLKEIDPSLVTWTP